MTTTMRKHPICCFVCTHDAVMISYPWTHRSFKTSSWNEAKLRVVYCSTRTSSSVPTRITSKKSLGPCAFESNESINQSTEFAHNSRLT
jgi:hypothetical protein